MSDRTLLFAAPPRFSADGIAGSAGVPIVWRFNRAILPSVPVQTTPSTTVMPYVEVEPNDVESVPSEGAEVAMVAESIGGGADSKVVGTIVRVRGSAGRASETRISSSNPLPRSVGVEALTAGSSTLTCEGFTADATYTRFWK